MRITWDNAPESVFYNLWERLACSSPSFFLRYQLTYIFICRPLLHLGHMIEVWSWESKQRRVVSLGLTSTNFPCTMPFFFTCYLGMVCQSSFGNDRSKRAERLSAWVTSNLLMHPSDHWHGFLDFMWAWNKNKLLCYAAVMGFIYYNIHCFFNHYNSLGYSNFDLGSIAFVL